MRSWSRPRSSERSESSRNFERIKPREHNMLGVEIAEAVFEPRAGGRVYDRGVDGSEYQWARVLAFEPPNRLLFSWDISRAGHSTCTVSES